MVQKQPKLSAIVSTALHAIAMQNRSTMHDVDRVPFFDAFLSYSSKDGTAAVKLAELLVRDGFDVFLDSWFIRPGHSIAKVIPVALRKSRKVLALMTPTYFQSPWTDFELNWNFVESHLSQAGTEAPLIPVLIRKCDIPKNVAGLRRIDLAGDRWEAGYGQLVQALSNVDSLAIDAYVLTSATETSYLIEFVAGKLRNLLRFPDPRIQDVTRTYLEIVQNAFQHGPAKANQVEVSVRADAGQTTLEVTDAGGGFDLASELRRSRQAIATDPSSPGRRGLIMVEAMCDRLSNAATRRRHTVTAVLYRDRISAEIHDLATGEAKEGAWLLKSVDPRGRYIYVRVTAPTIDQNGASEVEHFLQRILNGEQFKRVIVDLSSVEYVSSASLRVLAMFHRQLRASGRSCALVAASGTLQEILRVSGFNLVFEVFHSSEDALKSLPD